MRYCYRWCLKESGARTEPVAPSLSTTFRFMRGSAAVSIDGYGKQEIFREFSMETSLEDAACESHRR